MVSYRVPVADELLKTADFWRQVDGLRLVEVSGPWLLHPGVSICTFEDDYAPPELAGLLVEPILQRNGEVVTVIDRRVIST